jgi:hypothetical protein
VGVALGAGAAYATQHDDGLLGDTSRAIGDVALQVRAKAKDIDRKHNVVQVAREQSQRAWNNAKEYDDHQVLERSKTIAVKTAKDTCKFVKQHQIVERSVKGARNVTYWAAERILANKERRERRLADVNAPDNVSQHPIV